ncbi:M1 family metallopeptidase [Azospira restricta]|uniref:M1 family peptidase n=1 Tax=Azospira restricta TaxID=404405 RepID=A0A974SS92_9RHOO|nr:M1 family aminopeptidase [Azospira restricta]QRJ65545.1 M1 family peptidase [Azospira restricta]
MRCRPRSLAKRLLPLLAAFPFAAAATPQLDLDVRLDPATRAFAATARLAESEPTRSLAGFALAPNFEITALSVDGRAVPPVATPRAGRQWVRLPAGTKRAEIAYRATLAPLQALDHREVLQSRAPTADPDGSFLPAVAGWYPDPGELFSYRVALALPAGQKGLTPGELVHERDDADGYRAEFRFPQPADGIDLMAGPYVVGERTLTLAGDRKIRIRTWFHPELASLATGYLDDSARYVERYSRLIGDYPFALFSVVSSPTPTGFGMPGLTYLGRDVLRLPFIRATSLGHEVLHNWWGNGVYPDWAKGNWSEGLTTFLADYAYKEDEGEAAALDMRLGWLRDLAAVPPGADTALRDFVARRHGISSIVGYNKAAMLFLMLKDEIGADVFERGLRRFWHEQRFRSAGWAELEAAFAREAGRPLRGFFKQWVERAGAPALQLAAAERQGDALAVTLTQRGAGSPYALAVPLRLVFADRVETRRVPLATARATIVLKDAGAAQAVELDPDYRLWRRVDPAVLPAILREVFVAPQAALQTVDADPALQAAARALAVRLLDSGVKAETAGPAPMLVIGSAPAVDAWLAARGLPPRPATAGGRGTAQVWAGRDAAGTPYAVVSGNDAAALRALERGLPHYGRQSWLVFDGGRAADKGVWPPRTERIAVGGRAPK